MADSGVVRVKICGITSVEDARAAVAAGADALGFVFHRPSPRYLSPDAAREITRQLPPFIARIGVFVDSPLADVKEILHYCHLDFAQLHGEENATFCSALAPRAIKTVQVGRDDAISVVRTCDVVAFVLDTYRPGSAGGTGTTFDWRIAVEAVATGRPIILSGGLRPENVAEAIAMVRPYAVDVASGVEALPGKKDLVKLRAFITAAKGTHLKQG